MAVVYQKKAGQWAKSKARDYQYWAIAVAFVAAVTGGFFVGVAATTWRHPLFLTFCLAPIVIGFFYACKVANRRFDRWAVERVRYLRGGQAEALVAWWLQDLSNDWHVFHNLIRPNGADIDHILVGPPGVFVLSTKSYKGHVTRHARGTIYYNGNEMPELEEAVEQALWLKDCLKAILPDKLWVQPVLVLPLCYVDVPPTEGRVWVLDEKTLMQVFNPEKPGKRALTVHKVEQITCDLHRVIRQAS